MELLNLVFIVIGLTGNMNKYMIIALRKRAKQTIKAFSKRLEEYNSITNSNIDFHTFFVDVLNYSEEDYLNLLTVKIKFEKRSFSGILYVPLYYLLSTK
jgi:hypothetical protein